MSSLFIDKFPYSNTLEIKLFCEFQKTLLIKFLIPEKTFINSLHLRDSTLDKKICIKCKEKYSSVSVLHLNEIKRGCFTSASLVVFLC